MQKVLIVLLDAIEPSLVEQWTRDGSLPAMARLRARGRYGRLASASKLAGLPWLPLYTGRDDAAVPPYFLVWNPASMSLERLRSEELDVPIFWRNLPVDGPRVIALDMPFVSRPVPFNGIEVTAWMTHDTIFESVQTYPPELGADLLRKFGRDLRFREKYGTLDPAEFFQVRDRLIDMTVRVTDLAVDFMQREKWDLFLVGYGTLHSAGHKLWDGTNVRAGHARPAELAAALKAVYIAADRALDRLVAGLDAETIILVLSVHGMRSNTTCNEILPEMLRRVLAGPASAAPAPSAGWLRKVRQLIPYELRHSIKSRLPVKLQDLLTSFWRSGLGNWQHKKAFTIASDNQGMIRLNLRGREVDGTLQPEEYADTCRQIEAGLKTFVDADSGQPVIRDILRTDAVLTQHAAAGFYPDLLIEWADLPAATHRAVSSPSYGIIAWPVPGRNPDGRSGNHSMTGILLAAGPGVDPGAIEGVTVQDIAPTVLTLLGLPLVDGMTGRPIALRE